MRRVKIISWPQWDTPRGILFLTVVICSLLLSTGCRPSEKEAKIQVEPEKQKPMVSSEIAEPEAMPEEQKSKEEPETKKPEAEPEKQIPPAPVFPAAPSRDVRRGGRRQEDAGVELKLKFTPQDSTTYKVITEAQRRIKGEGALANDSTFKGGTTSNRIEMTFTQQVKSVDDKGNAVAEITIKGLKRSSVEKDNTILDFDSSREPDLNNPLGALIGQIYTIEITPDGQVSKVIDVNQAMTALKGTSSANQTAKQIISQDAIKERHAIPALSACDKKQLRTGDNWKSIKAFSFGMMGAKSLERIYTLKEIKDVANHRIAVVEMDAIPSSEMAEELHKEEVMGIFSKMFDSTDTYTGKLQLDLNSGKVKEYFEKLRSEWTAVDPMAGKEGDKEPAALRMTAARLYHIEKID